MTTQALNRERVGSLMAPATQLSPDDRFPSRKRPIALALGLAALVLNGAYAADDVKPKPATGDDAVSLDTITVTARRRPESLQKVPVAVSVISGQSLEDQNRNNLASIAQEVPTVNFRSNGSSKDTALLIRGIGTISTSPGAEPSVSAVVDGVVLARPGQATLDLVNVDRIEVLRGPQGTLFGKNASAGVINIVSKAPSKTREGYIEGAWLGGGNERRVHTHLSGPVNEQLRGALDLGWSTYDGNVTNVANGKKRNGYNRNGGRGKIEYDATPDVRVSVIADYSDGVDTTVQGVITSLQTAAYPSGTLSAPNTTFGKALLPVVPSADNRQVNNNVDTRAQERNYGLSSQVDWRLGEHTLTSITAWRGWQNIQYQDLDRLSAPATGLPQQNDKGVVDFRQYSQEFRITSPRGQFLEYVGGLFLLRGESNETYRRDVTAVAPAPSGYGEAAYKTRANSVALFGEGTFNFTSTLRGIAGLRWNHDSLSYVHERVRNPSAAALAGVSASQAEVNGSTNANAFSGRIGPQFDITPNVTSYLTYSRGYKGPAFNVFFNFLTPRDTLALKPETSNSYEIGLKSTSFDNRLRLNVAAFYTKYDNFQTTFADVLNGTFVTRLINAGKVSTKGLEVDITAKPISSLSISGSLARINARIDHFICPPGSPTSCDVDGKALPYSPDWKANLQGTWFKTFESGRVLELSSDYSWQSKTQYSIAEYQDTIQPAYGIWNASVALVDATGGWRAAFLVKNIANKSYATNLSHDANVLNRWVPRDDQRYFGVQLRKDFF